MFRTAAAVALLATTATADFTPSREENLNGEYLFSNTPGASGFTIKRYRDYPGGVDMFEVYSPEISQLYSQVFWKGLDPVDLPKEIVERYKGKGMAVVGFEMDQVRRVPSKANASVLEDVSVPLTVAYNHHFESTMVGGNAAFEKIVFDGANDPRIQELEQMHGHGIPSHKEHWTVVEGAHAGHDELLDGIPTSMAFGGANGGEYRLSYHGYAPGFAQVIQSPRQFQITPMQIDTWNRDEMPITEPSPFVPGPLPRTSEAPADAVYSGLLECPVTTRIKKNFPSAYEIVGTSLPSCPDGQQVSTNAECLSAAKALFPGKSLETREGGTLGCSVRALSESEVGVFFNTDGNATCGTGATHLLGSSSSLVNVSVSLSQPEDEASITLTGPSDVWFGVGFNAHSMADQPWTIVVEGTGSNTTVTERQLGNHNPGSILPASLKVVSIALDAKRKTRTVVLSRRLKGNFFTFDVDKLMHSNGALPFINAVGSKPTISYHKAHAIETMTLLPSSTTANDCVCRSQNVPFGSLKGSLSYVANASQKADVGGGSVSWNNDCPAEPWGDLLSMKNPTCDIRTYSGGQIACHHMWSLLDADQEIPWPDTPLKYHLKFRFWVQPFNASYHVPLTRETWGIASPVEYDIPACKEGLKGCHRGEDGSWVHTITGRYKGDGKLVAAHFHCHAPACLSMAMYKCPSNISVADCNETTAELLCEEKPVYGLGNGKPFQEPGFILQPPCLWGSPDFGLKEPVDVTGATLFSKKTANATFAHHGEMAWQQMYLQK